MTTRMLAGKAIAQCKALCVLELHCLVWHNDNPRVSVIMLLQILVVQHVHPLRLQMMQSRLTGDPHVTCFARMS